jgi:hypothetical protein
MGDVVAVGGRPHLLAQDGVADIAAQAPASPQGRNEWGLTPAVRHLDRPE